MVWIFKKGDIVRAHTNGTAQSTTSHTQFTISKTGKAHAFPAVKDQKVEIPTSEIRYESTVGLGTGAETWTVKYQTLTKSVGDALSVDNSNATIITVLKDGLLSINTSFRMTTQGRFAWITKNSVTPNAQPLNSEILAAEAADSTAALQDLNWTGLVQKGDKIRVIAEAGTAPSSPNANSMLSIVHQEQKVSVAVNNIEPQYGEEDSFIRLGGQASLSANVISFGSVIETKGTDITLSGSQFLINKSGTYSIHATVPMAALDNRIHITKNSTAFVASDPSVLNWGATHNSAGYDAHATWSGYLEAGDIIRLTSGNTVTASNSNSKFTISRQANPSIIGIDGRPLDAYQQEANSLIRVAQTNGSGAVATRIKRFSNLITQEGSGVTFTDDANNGSSFTINEDGFYSISYTDNGNTATDFGISLNASSLTTNIGGLSQAERLAQVTPSTGGYEATATWAGPLKKGDILRAHTDGVNSADATTASFSVSKVGSITRSIPLVDSTIDIPTSEIRMTGTTSKGGTDTFIVRFNNLEKISGEGLSLINDAATGTVIKVQKDGVLSVMASLFPSAPSDIYLSKNQVVKTANPVIGEQISHFTVSTAGYHGILTSTLNVKVGDEIRVSMGATPGGSNNAILSAIHQETKVAVAISNVKPEFEDVDSMIRLDTANGTGSTNTRIPRWSSVREIKGSGISYLDSATDGSSFVINEAGTYNISFSWNHASNGATSGISLNSTQLTTDVDLINPENRLAESISAGVNYDSFCSWSGFLKEGDIIRPHLRGTTAGVSSRCHFTIAKQALPSIAEVDITPFADLNQQVYQASEWKNLGPITITATTTPPNKGTVVYDRVKGRRNGRHLELRYEYEHDAAGTAGTGEYFFGIPSTFDGEIIKIDPSVVELSTGVIGNTHSTIGHGYIYNDTSRSEIAAIPYDDTRFRVLASYAGTSGFISNGHFSFNGSGMGLGFMVTIPVLGWEDYSSEYERVYAVEDNENVFSAKITNNGTALIASQSYPFIDSVSRTAAGIVVVNFKGGFFSETPSVTVVPTNTALRLFGVTSVSASSATISTNNTSAIGQDHNFDIIVQRQGADYRDLQRQIVSLKEFPKVNNQLTQHIQHLANGNTLLNATAEIRFNTANLTTAGDSILSIEDDLANTRTKFVALKDCIVDVHFSGVCTDPSEVVQVYKNGALIARGSQTPNAASYYSSIDTSVRLLTGDYVSVTINGGAIASTTNPCFLNIVAQGQELKSVGNLAGGENIFSAKVNGQSGTPNANRIVSQNVKWINSVNALGPAGNFEVVFTPGFFSQPPAMSAITTGNATDDVRVYDVGISSCKVYVTTPGGSGAWDNFDITAYRQGTDYKDAQAQIIQLDDFPRVSKTLTDSYTAVCTVVSGNITALANVNDQTGSLFGTPTIVAGDIRVVIQKDCLFTLHSGVSSTNNAAWMTVTVNGVVRASSASVGTTFQPSVGGGSFTEKLKSGDIVLLNLQNQDNTANNPVSFSAIGSDLERVDNVDKVENVHTIVVQAGTSNILARNTNFLTVTRTGQGIYNATYAYPLTSQPSVVVTCLNIGNEVGTSGLSNYGYAHNFTANGFSYKIGYENGEGGDGGFLQDRNHTVVVSLQGDDYKSIQDIVVSLPESKTKWQKKIMTTANTPSQMNFSNLELGKTYRLSLHAYMQVDGSESAIELSATHNGGYLTRLQINGGTAADIASEKGTSIIFVATGTTVTFSQASVGGNPTISANITHATLEELPLHEQTSQW